MTVVDAADERLADYVRLREVSLRRSLEAERGLFIAEGDKVVRRAVVAGYAPRSFLMAPRWLEPLADVLALAGEDVPCYVADDVVVESLTGFHVHRGALAAIHRPPPRTVDEVVDGARRIAVLEDLVDHANVGAVLRSAAALGVDGVLLSPRCADPLYRRAVKVSMGAVFDLPWTRLADWHGAPDLLRRLGFTTLALTPSPDAVDVSDVDRSARLAIVLGGEGHGLSGHWQRAADLRVRIPMTGDVQAVDSLNVAAAAAVAFYALRPSPG